METKDIIALIGITVTFLVSSATLAYSLWSNKQSSFVNTVTSSRLKWIDSLRDKVSEFIAVTTRISDEKHKVEDSGAGTLLLQRDTLLHQIVLHLNPRDSEDQRIRALVDHVRDLTNQGKFRMSLPKLSSNSGMQRETI
jgi:hypothetical protein